VSWRRTSLREFADRADWSEFNSAVSLHSHTFHSWEVMSDLPAYIARIPIVAEWFARELRSRDGPEGRRVDFSKGWWHPPVSPRGVFESEAAQIEARFDLAAIVSVTDHDSIAAGFELQQLYAIRRAPLSFEWTVPFCEGFFHLGVHNLPPSSAAEWFARLSAFTGGTSTEALADILHDLDARADLLLVFNHPHWDLAGVGDDVHAKLLGRFLADHGPRLHAVEVNGYRSPQENARVRSIGVSSGLPVISGGDRHACAANAIVNVTTAQSFEAFAGEVRDGVSHVVVMPAYRQHLVARKLAAAADVMRHYRSYPVHRQRWMDRISCDEHGDGNVQPLSYHWPDGGPLWVRSSIAAFRLLTSPVVLPIIAGSLALLDPSAGFLNLGKN
jgi:hypothetical protein